MLLTRYVIDKYDAAGGVSPGGVKRLMAEICALLGYYAT